MTSSRVDNDNAVTRVSGVCVEIAGLGVLLTGVSGIGKTECALELLSRGHKFVADDRVEIRREDGFLIANAPAALGFHLHVRDIGILNAVRVFGVQAVAEATRLALVVELVAEGTGDPVRLGDETAMMPLLNVALPHYRLSRSPGRNVALLLEILAKKEIHRRQGCNAAKDFVENHNQRLTNLSDSTESNFGDAG